MYGGIVFSDFSLVYEGNILSKECVRRRVWLSESLYMKGNKHGFILSALSTSDSMKWGGGVWMTTVNENLGR